MGQTHPPIPATDPMPKPPRRVRLRPDAFWRVWIPRLAGLPFIAAGAFLFFIVLYVPVIRVFGSSVDGRVERVENRRTSRDEHGNIFDVTFTYDIGHGNRETDHGWLHTGHSLPPTVGDIVPIRALVIGPFAQAMLANSEVHVGALIIIGLFATVWCSVVGFGTVVAWVGPIFDRRLVRDGEMADGAVTRKNQTKRGRTRQYEVFYHYHTADGIERTGMALVAPSVFQMLHEGQAIKAMYRPALPAVSTLYEASAYEIAGQK